MSNNIGNNIRDALQNRDPAKFIAAINSCLAYCCDTYEQGGSQPKGLYRSIIMSMLYGMGADFDYNKHLALGRVDFIIRTREHTWVIELKVARHNDDAKRAAEAMREIIEKDFARGMANPVLLGFAINDKERTIKHWECRGGRAERPAKPRP